MTCVKTQHRCISSIDLARIIQNNNLGSSTVGSPILLLLFMLPRLNFCVGVVDNFIIVGAEFLHDFLMYLLFVGWLSGIHFVNTNNSLFHIQCISQKGMLTNLSIFGDTSFKFINTCATTRTAQLT